MSKFFNLLKVIIQKENEHAYTHIELRALSNMRISSGVSLFVLIIFIIYQFIFVFIDGYIDLRLEYVIPVASVVCVGPVYSYLYKKECYEFLARRSLILLHAMMYALAFWLDCFTDPSLCQIYTPILIAVGPVLFLRSFKTELLINTLALLVYLFATYLGITPISADHAVIQAFIAYALSIMTLIVISNMRYTIARSSRSLNDEIQKREKYEYAAEVAESLNYDFLNVYSVDLNKNTCRIIKSDGYLPEEYKDYDEGKDYPYDKIMNKCIEDRVYKDEKEFMHVALSIDTIREKLKEENAYIGSYRVLDDQSGEHYCQFRFVKIPSTNKVIAAFRNIDITMRYRKDQRVALEEALKAATQASEAKTTFMNNISHDILTPMNAIIGFNKQAMSDPQDTDAVMNNLKKIDTSSHQLLNYLNKVLAVTQTSSGPNEFEASPHSLKLLAQNLISRVSDQSQEKNITIHFDNSEVKDDMVRTNAQRFEQAIFPILENAVIYSPENGRVSFTIRQSSLIGNGKCRYIITIKDNGMGIPKDFMPYIFDPFVRMNNDSPASANSVGLGLTISKNIVESTGGGILVNSEPGKGTEVTIVAMLYTCEENKEEKKEQQKNVDCFNNGKEFKDTRVLVVDDNEVNREIADGLLQMKGFLCETAESGTEAISKIKEHDTNYYSAILMDIFMPDLDGFETTKKIREINTTIPIIALSANTNTLDRDKALLAGMNDFISKPFNVNDFIKAMNDQFTTH